MNSHLSYLTASKSDHSSSQESIPFYLVWVIDKVNKIGCLRTRNVAVGLIILQLSDVGGRLSSSTLCEGKGQDRPLSAVCSATCINLVLLAFLCFGLLWR